MAQIPLTFRRLRVASALAAALLAGAGPALAQEATSRPVVQPLPPPEAGQLSEALRKLSGNPRDLDALIAAGNASLKLDDVDAALGFYARADDVSPGEPRARAGVAAAMVKEENPFDALRLFDEAERAGATLTELTGERALAYDLVGDNARAQALYREALARGENAEISRRLAVSLAISGNQAEMERVLLPMLNRRDLAAYRARAFSLAIGGKVEEAMSIVDAVMPPAMAAQMAPYLGKMPRLTRAQQAAAANLGNFPRESEIGRDDPRIAQYVSSAPVAPPPQVAAADSRLVPAGAPLGPAAESGRRRPDREGEEVALVRVEATAPPAVAMPTPSPTSSAPEPVPVAMVAAEPPAPEPAPAPAFDLGEVSGSRVAAAAPVPPTPAAQPEAEPTDVASAFADFDFSLSPTRPAAGAVDIAMIAPPRERPVVREPPKPAPPAHPSRVWVQVATGRDRSALAFDWRRMVRDSKGAFGERKPFVARWGQTNRLVTGPFANSREAQAFIAKLKTAGVSSFAFTSDEGEEVAALPVR